MSLGEIPKKAMAWLRPNAAKAWNFMHSTPTGASFTRWAAAGAVVGGVRGLADNIVGEDRVSVLGGMIQGAIMGAGVRGIGHGWRNRGKISGWVSSKLKTNASTSSSVVSGLGGVTAGQSLMKQQNFTMRNPTIFDSVRGRARMLPGPLTTTQGRLPYYKNIGAPGTGFTLGASSASAIRSRRVSGLLTDQSIGWGGKGTFVGNGPYTATGRLRSR